MVLNGHASTDGASSVGSNDSSRQMALLLAATPPPPPTTTPPATVVGSSVSSSSLVNGGLPSSSCSSSSASAGRPSLVRMSAEKRGKKVRFYRNGDRFFGGVVLVVSCDHYRSWHSLLTALNNSPPLTQCVDGLPSGVRQLFTVDGSRLHSVEQLLCDDLTDGGGSVVCAGSEPFRQLDYCAIQSPLAWCDARRSTPSSTGSVKQAMSSQQRLAPHLAAGSPQLSDVPATSSTPPLSTAGHCSSSTSSVSVIGAAVATGISPASNGLAQLRQGVLSSLVCGGVVGYLSPTASVGGSTRDYIRPRLVCVVRCGRRPRRVVRFLLNRRTAHSLDQVLQQLSELVRLDSGAIKKLLSADGSQVRELHDFFASEDVFFAYGNEKHRVEDFELHADEAKWIAGKSHARLQCGQLSSSRRRPFKTAAGGGGEPWSDVRQAASAACRTLATPGARRRRNRASRAAAADVNGVSRAAAPTTNGSNDNTDSSDAAGTAAAPGQDAVVPADVQRRYWIGRKIGDGNFAVVYQCVHRLNGDECAVKVIDKSKCVGKEDMIDNEVAILRSVRHDNIIRLVEHIECPQQSAVCLVLEFVKGGDLFDAISAVSRYSEPEVGGMLHDLCAALSYLHQQSIVHRDVKPENLLLVERADGSKSIKLADFGLAQRVSGPLYTVCGTPTYVAPEILAGTGYGVKVDVWAAGVITYILLCGFPPFGSADNNQEELFDCVLSGQFEFIAPYWDDISEAACQLIIAMLQVDSDARFSADDVLVHPWVSSSCSEQQTYLQKADRRRLRWNDLEMSDNQMSSSISPARSLPCLAASMQSPVS